jgi:hypothetical protein
MKSLACAVLTQVNYTSRLVSTSVELFDENGEFEFAAKIRREKKGGKIYGC